LAQALTFYDRAKTVFPHEGKIFHQLGLISAQDKDFLNAVNLFMRALSCSFPNQATKENLINLLQQIRMMDIEDSKLEANSSGLKPVGKIETVSDTRFMKFFNCFCRTQTVLYTRIGVDELERLYARQQLLLKEYLTLSADSASNKLPEAKRLVFICLIMVFIVHATITDETTQSKLKDLKTVFKSQLPQGALRQMTDFMLQITDRIIAVPSTWLIPLTPLVLWLSLHRDDGLAGTLFDESPALQQELTRIHQLLGPFCLEYQTI